MRIALIDPSLFTLPYDVALAGGLAAIGEAVTLHGRALTREDGSAGAIAVQPSFYPVAGSKAAGLLPKKLRLAIKGLDHVASMLRLRRRLAAERPDIIHFQWLPLPGIDGRLMRGFTRTAPVVLTVHDTDPFNGSPTARLQSMGFVASLNACDRLIVHTAQGRARLVAQGVAADRIAVLPHGSLAAAAPKPPSDRMEGPLTFVLFGKIKPYKGADLLIEAFAALPAALRAQARLHIVGQAYMDLGPLRQAIAAHGLAGGVTLEDRFVEDAKVPAIFPPSSIAVFPYREIEASGVLSLALAQGRPIIASRLGSFGETLQDGVHGRLLPPGDVPALSAAMQQLIEDRPLAARFGQAALHLASDLPDWTEIARLTVALYDAARGAREAATSTRATVAAGMAA